MKKLAISIIVMLIITISTIFILTNKKEKRVLPTTDIEETTTITTTEENVSKNESKKEKTPSPTEIKPGKNEVFIFSNRFEPVYLEISVGEIINFINKDSVEHIIEFSNPPLTKRILPNDSFSFSFSSRGKITVTDERGFSLVINVN